VIPLEKQVCNLALAKRLKELGVEQESYFKWIPSAEDDPVPTSGYEYEEGGYSDEEEFAAFTVTELGEMLPSNTYSGLEKSKTVATAWRSGDSTDFHAYTEADARAKMLIYLVENNVENKFGTPE
jgi:hypothetical protein